MKLSDQVCTLGQGRKLKKLGVPQASLFYHTVCPNNIIHSDSWIDMFGAIPIDQTTSCSAFNVAELGVMLPEWISCKDKKRRILQWHNSPADFDLEHFKKLPEQWRIVYRNPYNELDGVGDDIHAPTEAQARAAMLIYLLETSLITSEEVNKRINNS